MAKAKIQEVYNLTVEGSLNLEGGKDNNEIVIEVEEVGEKTLSELLRKFNGEYVKISVRLANEVLD